MICLSKVDWDALEQWEIQAIKPDHGTFTFVTMVMECPRGCEDEVALLHGDLLAVYGGETATTFDNVPQRECDVPVCWRSFARIDDLEASVQCVCRIGRL
jgi:hypothetical protein